MIYVTEEFYLTKYLLGRNPAIDTGFHFYARQASRVVDRYTFGRLGSVSESEIPEEVQMCCCELAETLYQQQRQKTASGGKISEKIGTYSVTFSNAQEAANAAASEQRSIIMKWLSNTGLCYRGVGCPCTPMQI